MKNNLSPLFNIIDKKPRFFALEHSLEKLFTMNISIFMDLQGFIIGNL